MSFSEYTYRQELVDDIRLGQDFISPSRRAWSHVDFDALNDAELEQLYERTLELVWIKMNRQQSRSRRRSVAMPLDAYRSEFSGMHIWERSG